MKVMPRPFSSVNEPKGHPWLDKEYEKKENRTFDFGKKAIDQLLKENEEITYNSISEKSKVLDPEGQGIHPNSVKRNKKLYEYYKEHSKTYARKKVLEERDKAYRGKPRLKGFDHIQPGRSKADVRKRYGRLTKNELVERLIAAEEYIAEQNERWLIEQFDNIDDKIVYK